jgi:endoribonuclease Dicer
MEEPSASSASDDVAVAKLTKKSSSQLNAIVYGDELGTISDAEEDLNFSEDDSSSHKSVVGDRNAENVIFEQHAFNLAEQFTKREIKQPIQRTDDEKLSVKELLAKQGNSERITDARGYQVELFERAKLKNIIAVLDTGSGKTHIATLLLRWILDKELQDRSNGHPHRISFFLVSFKVR